MTKIKVEKKIIKTSIIHKFRKKLYSILHKITKLNYFKEWIVNIEQECTCLLSKDLEIILKEKFMKELD